MNFARSGSAAGGCRVCASFDADRRLAGPDSGFAHLRAISAPGLTVVGRVRLQAERRTANFEEDEQDLSTHPSADLCVPRLRWEGGSSGSGFSGRRETPAVRSACVFEKRRRKSAGDTQRRCSVGSGVICICGGRGREWEETRVKVVQRGEGKV